MDPNGASRCIKVVSFVRGYHAHVNILEPEIGEKRQLTKCEPSNIEDINYLAVVREKAGNEGNTDNTERKNDVHPNHVTTNDEVIEHVPRLMACAVTKFLKRGTNSGHLEVTGKRVNREAGSPAGYGLEIPCVYQFTGDRRSCKWLKTKLEICCYEIHI